MVKIAICDDETEFLDILSESLSSWCRAHQLTLQLYRFTNGDELISAHRAYGMDLILLDIQMPDMNGLQMLKEARERGSMTKVVILTAYSDFDYAKKAIALGIENYLLKPVNLTELKNTLSKIKEEIFVEQRGKNSLSLETVIKDALEGEYEEDSRLEEMLLEKYGFSGRKQIYCM